MTAVSGRRRVFRARLPMIARWRILDNLRRSSQDPGYIKDYPPGVRENGGQYTHASVWVVMALARLGSGDEAAELFHMLNPMTMSWCVDGGPRRRHRQSRRDSAR
jgi:glycosyl hydrolase family 36